MPPPRFSNQSVRLSPAQERDAQRLDRRSEINSRVQNANDAVVDYAKRANIPLAPGADKSGQSQANRERTERDVAAAARSNSSPNTGTSSYTGPSLAYKPGPGIGERVAVPATDPGAAVRDAGPRPPDGTAAAAAWADRVLENNKSVTALHDAPAPEKPRYGPDSTKGQPASAADIAALNANDRAIGQKNGTGTPEIAANLAGTGATVYTPYGEAKSTNGPAPKDYALQPGKNGGVVPSLAAQAEIMAKYPQINDPKSPEHAAFLKAWQVATDGKKPGDVVDNHLAIAENAVTSPQNSEGAGKRAGIAERPDSSDKGTPGKDIAKATPAPAAPSAAAQAGQSVSSVPGAVADTVKNYWDAAKGAVSAVGGVVKEFGEGVTGNAGGGARPNAQVAQGGDTAMTPEERAAWGGNTTALPVAKEQSGEVARPSVANGTSPTSAPVGSTPTYGQNQQPAWTQGAGTPTALDHAQAYADAFHKSVAPMFKAAQQSVSTAPPDSSVAKGAQSPLNGGNDLNPAAPMTQQSDNNQAKGSQSALNGGNDIGSGQPSTPANSSAQGVQSPQNANPDADLPKYRSTGSY